jgi:hypothetical protein
MYDKQATLSKSPCGIYVFKSLSSEQTETRTKGEAKLPL